MAETADVPEEGTHHATIEGLLDPRMVEALWALRAAVRERVRPQISSTGVPEGWGAGVRRRRPRVSASFPSRISRAWIAAICSKGVPTSTLKTTDESRDTLARWPSGTASSAENEQLEELEGMLVAPDSSPKDAVTGVNEARVRRAYDTV